MQLDSNEVTIGGFVLTWVGVIFGIGKTYGKHTERLEALEEHNEKAEKDLPVTLTVCTERRSNCEKINKIQFDSGTAQFAEVKKLIAENDRASNERHTEIMKFLMEMNKS